MSHKNDFLVGGYHTAIPRPDVCESDNSAHVRRSRTKISNTLGDSNVLDEVKKHGQKKKLSKWETGLPEDGDDFAD